jgi:hypothetical protein
MSKSVQISTMSPSRPRHRVTSFRIEADPFHVPGLLDRPSVGRTCLERSINLPKLIESNRNRRTDRTRCPRDSCMRTRYGFESPTRSEGGALAMMCSTAEREGSCASPADAPSASTTAIDGPNFDDELRAPGDGAVGPVDFHRRRRRQRSTTTLGPWPHLHWDGRVGGTLVLLLRHGQAKRLSGGRRCLLAVWQLSCPFSVREPGPARPNRSTRVHPHRFGEGLALAPAFFVSR